MIHTSWHRTGTGKVSATITSSTTNQNIKHSTVLQANTKLNTHRQMAPFRNGSVLHSIRWFQCRDRPKWQNEANTSKIITIITICLLLHSAHRQALGLAVCAGFVLLCSTSTSHFPSLSPAPNRHRTMCGPSASNRNTEKKA